MSDLAFHADLAGLDDLVARMLAFERQAETITGQVDSDISRLHGDWAGAAAEAHLQAHRRWREGAAEMHAAVTKLRAAVATAHGNYSAAIGANGAMWA